MLSSQRHNTVSPKTRRLWACAVLLAACGSSANPSDDDLAPVDETPSADAAPSGVQDAEVIISDASAPEQTPSDAGPAASLDAQADSELPKEASVEPPALDVLRVPGVVLWLDAALGVVDSNGRVTRWRDRSPEHNDAFQDNAGVQPSLVQGPHARPVVRFSGKTDPKNGGGDGGPFLTIRDAASLNWGSSDWSIVVVAGYSNPLDGTHNGVLGTFFGKFGKPEILFAGNWPLTEHTEQGALHIGLGERLPGVESTRKGLNDGALRVYTARKAGDILQLRVNGMASGQKGGAGAANVDSRGVDIGIGSFSGKLSTRCLKGDIESLIAIRGALSDAALNMLESQLMTHYGIAP